MVETDRQTDGRTAALLNAFTIEAGHNDDVMLQDETEL